MAEGVAQAKAYSEKLQIRFTFSSNGQGIYGIDMEGGVEGEVARDPTPDELWNITFAKQDRWREYFAAIPFEDRGGYFQGRYYQDIAIERVLEAIAAGDLRILLTLLDAEKSDLFDVLLYVAYAMPPLTREERASKARVEISSQFYPNLQAFLESVLSHYVNVGVQELDQDKLTPLLKLKYHDSLPGAMADLGAPKQIQEVFIGFQKFLYVSAA